MCWKTANKCIWRLFLGTNYVKLAIGIAVVCIKFKFPFTSLLSHSTFYLFEPKVFIFQTYFKSHLFYVVEFSYNDKHAVFTYFSRVAGTNEGGWKDSRFCLNNHSITVSYRYVSVSQEHGQALRRGCLPAWGKRWSNPWPEFGPYQPAFSWWLSRPVLGVRESLDLPIRQLAWNHPFHSYLGRWHNPWETTWAWLN